MKESSQQGLNAYQLKVVQELSQHLIVVAGPGTGKTLTFAHKVANLLEEKKISGEEILGLTFTRSAAQEMKERLGRILSQPLAKKELPLIWINTFHAIALRILQEESYPFGPGSSYSLIEENEKRELLNQLAPKKEISRVLEEIRKQKQKLQIPQEGIGIKYQKLLFENKSLDFDDLFCYVSLLFKERPEILEKYRKRFSVILCDEFQDTSFAQYHFIHQLVSKHFLVFGDPDQAIYSFTGDFFSSFEQFKKDYPDHKILSLSENYRSQMTILEAAKQVINKNQSFLPRELEARMEEGLPIQITSYQTERQESEMIVREIESLLGGSSYFSIDSQWTKKDRENSRYGFKDICILYRFHRESRLLKKALERAGLPYKVFEKETKKGEVSKVEDLQNFQNNESGLPEGEAITLMTLHRSKGLEFPVIFILGCEEGVIPYTSSENPLIQSQEIEEERRLFYVGMTRAKNRLFLSHAKKRMLFGKMLESNPSPFLQDIEEKLKVLEKSKTPEKKVSAQDNQLSLFN
ncbi:MAG: hypothetical protein A3I11_01710 [Elusimicrobia bacterium RIFCSPLOWO2_02_FULL_39_32]|nr:MAG: hypothetical protein A2034_04520 [Elusimicrobia bacterium GWA2_38_7]OGR78254.1 MAG: hypothetical protein A3B80_06195 [Elusimicrobia bacterium RIFCSPHIGHO2_02_FULL_39_36]OGR92392.1 MAG: hypothetical protein A3I11_01710 [Elusimicrobia bacterium RIFCSPLOWO2_02_FULL_39_32]OGR98935.1 MAG: hypothetical protein A3G85_04015 [Elusimicrobia bacterium RIFCSPLOWO2_12_FULL_39_28]